MRFDHTHEQDKGARTPTDRSADTPSVEQSSGRLAAARGMWVRLADSSAPAKERAVELTEVSRQRAAELATAARDRAVAALIAFRAWNAEQPLHLRAKTALAEGGVTRLALALGVLACLGLAAVIGAGGSGGGTGAPIDAVAVRTPGGTAGLAGPEADRIAAAEEASRGLERQAAPAAPQAAPPAAQPPAAQPPAAQPPAAPAPAPAAPAPAKAPAKPKPAAKPKAKAKSKPVAGLSQVQMDNAQAIVRTGQKMGLPKRAMVIAVATAMQESELLNRASDVLPESKKYKHQGTGWDHDSVGLFQQRTSSGWGPVKDLMNPEYSSRAFYKVLVGIPGWHQMRLTEAAQAVQVSAFQEHYAKHEGRAATVVNALTR
jgi:hypothetical protein